MTDWPGVVALTEGEPQQLEARGQAHPVRRAVQAGRHIVYSAQFSAAMAAFLFALSAIIVRGIREDVPPIGLSFWRTLLGFLIILPIFMRPVRLQTDLLLRHWRILSLLAFLLVIAGNALLYLSLQFTVVINVVVLNSVEPVLILAAAWLVFRDRVTYRQTFGIALSLFGVLFLISSGDVTNLAELELNQGDLLVLLAYLSWAFYAVLLRLLPAELDSRVLIVALLGVGSLFGLPLFLIEHFAFRPTTLGWVSILSIVVLALTNSVAAVFLWNRSVKLMGPGRAGPYMHLIPAYGVVMAIAVLDETFHLYHVIGICLIGIGIYYSTILRHKTEAS